MNLHGMAVGAISAINPMVKLTVRVSTGYTTDANHQRVPSYKPPVTVMGQVQPLTWRDIQHLDGLNLQGNRQAVYINGQVDGLVRPDNKGGDLITMEDGSVWLVVQMLETWPDWCKAAVVLQDS